MSKSSSQIVRFGGIDRFWSMFDRVVYQSTNGLGNIKPAQATILARQRGLWGGVVDVII
jgi:hypothetical protein